MEMILKENYELEHVHNFNKKIDSFKELSNYKKHHVLNFINEYIDFLNTHNYPLLTNVDMEKEMVMQEIFPEPLIINKYSFLIIEKEYIDELDINENDIDELDISEDDNELYLKTYNIVFFTMDKLLSSHNEVLIKNFNELKMPYIRKEFLRSKPIDLIQELIDKYNKLKINN